MSNTVGAGLPTPHEGQRQVLALPGRYKIAICGRRFGKTVAAAIAAVRKCEAGDNRNVWWISPIQEQSDRVERDVAFWLKERILAARTKRKKPRENDDDEDEPESDEPTWLHRVSEHAIICSNGSRIEFHSAHTPDRLRGAGLNLVVIDEAADVTEYTWNVVVKPMLLERRGEAFVVGTPRGKNNWLHRLFLLGQDEARFNTYSSIQLPTRSNPLILGSDLEEYRLEMTPELYRQEFDAEFIDGVSTVFAGADGCISGELLNAGRPGAKYITGIDLGQSVDFTVLCSIACATKRLEGFARFNQMDWSVQEELILAHLKNFPGPSIVDATGNGQRIYENLRDRHNGHVERFVFTAQSRAEILVGLQLAFAHKQIEIANARPLIDELHAFTLLGGGDGQRAKMSAPSGAHDDGVMALAMAWWGLEKRGLWSIASGFNPFANRGMFG